MAQRMPPVLPVPSPFEDAVAVCMAAKPLQHQDELVALLMFTQQVRPAVELNTIVEIGSFRGGTLELWARLAKRCVVSIDLPTEQFYGSANTIEFMQARDADFAARFPHVQSILRNSHDPETLADLAMRLRWASADPQPIDLLFIDGDHTYEGVKADYEMYAPLVHPGGVIAFHDVLHCDPALVGRAQFGVPAFFDLLPAPRFKFLCGGYWGGIGAIIVR